MIGKLKRKFILINMLLVTLVLLIVFGVLLLSQKQTLEMQSYDALRHALDRSFGDLPDKFPIGGKPNGQRAAGQPMNMLPVFTVLAKSDGTYELSAQNVDISQALAEEAAQAALQQNGKQERGILSSLGLRYMIKSTAEGEKLAFVDITHERTSLAGQVLSALLVGVGALLAFFVISLFLANWALRPVEHAWHQQKQFVADASHELKTPLTVILANTGILLSHPNATIAQEKKWLDHTRDEAQRMKTLVDDLLFLARADAAPQEQKRMPVDLSDVAWSCLLPFEPVAFEHGVSLESEIAENISLVGDEGQLKQLLLILLDNACKYAGKGGSVRFCLAREQERVMLSVRNSGEPIPAEEIPHLFERFYRADKSRARSKEAENGGYGLGLAIAERIVQAHRGRITAESGKEEGTVLTVLLPVK